LAGQFLAEHQTSK